MEAAQRLQGKIRATDETAALDGDNEPVIRFMANIRTTRAGTLNGGDDVRIAKVAHWPTSRGSAPQNANGRSVRTRENASKRMKLAIAVKVTSGRADKASRPSRHCAGLWLVVGALRMLLLPVRVKELMSAGSASCLLVDR